MPLTKQRIGPSGPFIEPDAATSENGLPVARMRCIATAGNVELTDPSDPHPAAIVKEWVPLTGPLTIPGTPGASVDDYRLYVNAKFMNRKTASSTNARVDITVELYNASTGSWIAAGGATDLAFGPEWNQNAVVCGVVGGPATAGAYTKARLTLAPNSSNTAINSMAGYLGGGADGNVIDVELYRI